MYKIIMIDERYSTYEEIQLNLSPVSEISNLPTITFDSLLEKLVNDSKNHYLLLLVSENGKITRKVGVQDGCICEWWVTK